MSNDDLAYPRLHPDDGYAYDGCNGYACRTLRASDVADRASLTLDVERLALAEYNVDQGNQFETLEEARTWAAAVAAEYAIPASPNGVMASPQRRT